LPGRSEALEATGSVAGTDDVVLEISADPAHARTARLFAAAAARHFGVDDERVEDLKVAISEAATNAINAHRRDGIDDPITLIAAPEPGGLRFAVVDAGAGFDPDVELSATYTPPRGLSEGSLGLTLIRSLFPTIAIERNADRGMTISFVVERSLPSSV